MHSNLIPKVIPLKIFLEATYEKASENYFLHGLQCFSVRGGVILLITTVCYHPQMLQIFEKATP